MNNAASFSSRLLLAAMSIALLGSTACGPIVFSGETARVIDGSGPPPPPAAEPPRVEVTDDKIVIREQVQFDYNRATIRKVSFDLLAEVAKVMNDNPRIKKIRVEGHASEEGSDEYNLALSKRRAFAVRDHLVKRGKVKASRLTHEGYGESRPIASNADEEGRSKNRRVEFVILEQDYVETKKVTDPNTGETQVTTTTKSAAE
jgi:outer membrane protein OmpA-like peptidoglycan-associated protein